MPGGLEPALKACVAKCTDGTRTPSADERSSDDWEMLGQPSPERPGSPPDLHRPSAEIAFDADLKTLATSALTGTCLVLLHTNAIADCPCQLSISLQVRLHFYHLLEHDACSRHLNY